MKRIILNILHNLITDLKMIVNFIIAFYTNTVI